MITCYACFAQFDQKFAVSVCSNPDCSAPEDIVKGARKISGLENAHIGNLLQLKEDSSGRRYFKCDKCKHQDEFVVVCPMCFTPIMPDLNGTSQVLTVALTGARNAGKTVYMVALIRTLKRMCEMRGYSLVGLYDTEKYFKEHYADPMYGNSQVVKGTPLERQKTLLYKVVSPGRSVILVIQDVAGETLQNIDKHDPGLSYIDNADLVVFMFDPYTVTSLMDYLEGLVPGKKAEGMEGTQVLNALLENVVSPTNRHTNFALVLSKFDVVQMVKKLGERNPLSALMSNPGISYMLDDSPLRENIWNYEEAKILDQDVRSLLSQRQIGGATLLNSAETAFAGRGDQLCAFAVSALGDAPDGQYLSSRGIASFRCLDPLQWAYARKYRGVLV